MRQTVFLTFEGLMHFPIARFKLQKMTAGKCTAEQNSTSLEEPVQPAGPNISLQVNLSKLSQVYCQPYVL